LQNARRPFNGLEASHGHASGAKVEKVYRMPRGVARTLQDVIREELLTILKDHSAPASARASAGRTLAEFYGADSRADGRKPLSAMSVEELDDEIAAASKGVDGTP